MSAIKQFDIIKRSYFTGGELIPIDELESPIGLRVEGGGYIFYDDAVGFSGGTTTPSQKAGTNIDAHALATTRWGVEASYGDYYYDMLRGCVVRSGTRTCNRFMVVDETDMVSSAYGSMLMWDTSTNASTSRATSTDFGQGSANTTLLCNAITDTTTIWPTVQYSRYKNPQGNYNASDSATDTRWFVPSRAELCVLLFMSYYDSSYRPITGIYKRQLQIPFWSYYWSSSQHSDYANRAWGGNFYYGNMDYHSKTYTIDERVRLCRTF